MASERLDAIEAEIKHHPDPVVSAGDVVDAIDDDLSRRTILNDMRVLERAGALESKDVGARAVAWWHVDRVTPAPPRDPADHPDQADLEGAVEDVDAAIAEADVDAETILRDLEADRDAGDGAGWVDDRRDVDDVQEESDDAIDAALDGWRPGQGAEDRARRREIGREVLDWLRSEGGPRERSEFVSALYEATALDGQGEKSWWVRLVRPALNQAVENGAVEKPSRVQYRWKTSV